MAIEVQTTQNVTIDYEPAGLGNRTLAFLFDTIAIVLWFVCWICVYYITDRQMFYVAEDLGLEILLYALIIAPVAFYHLLFEVYNNGQSIGKMFMKIRVVKTDGSRPSIGSLLIRWLFRPIDLELSQYMLGVIMIVCTKRSQRLGDFLAGTTVISLKINEKNSEVTLMDLNFQDDYQVVYIDVLNRLSDKDIQNIRVIVDDDKMLKNDFFVSQLSNRTKSLTGYTYDGNDLAFLRKVVSDYNYLALQ